MKKENLSTSMSSLIMSVTLIVCIGAMLGVAAYFMMNKTVKFSQPQVSPVTEPAKSVVDETADWQTYRNEEYGFEFKYPTGWFIYSDRTEAQTRIIQVASSLDRKIGEGTTFLGPVLDIRIPGENKDKGVPINMFGKSARDTGWQSGGSMGLAITRQISILTNLDITIYLRTSISDKSINSEKLTLDQILSTFKFTEK